MRIGACTHPRLHSFRLRRSFSATADATGELRLATRQYALVWINGLYLGRTYERTHEDEWRFRRFDLTPHLRAGRNTVALLLHHWGPTEEAIPGVQAAAEARFVCGGSAGDADFANLAAWRLLAAEDFLPARRHNHLIGHEELRDLRLEPAAWREPAFDDAAWTAPAVDGDETARFLPSPLPPLAEERVAPARVLACGRLRTGGAWRTPVAGRWWRIAIELPAAGEVTFLHHLRLGSRLLVDGADRSRPLDPPMPWAEQPEPVMLRLDAGRHVLSGEPRAEGLFRFGWVGAVPPGGAQVAWGAAADGPFGAAAGGEADPDWDQLAHAIEPQPQPLPRLAADGGLDLEFQGADHALLVEFPESITQLSRVRIADASPGARLELIASEQASDLPGLLLRAGQRNRAILRGGAQEWQIAVQYLSARVLLLIVRPEGGRVRLAGIDAIYRHQELRLSGDFACDDPRLRRIWELCRHTIEHGAQDVIVDGPWREQLLYMGDNLVHNQACYHLAADLSIVAWQHELYSQGQMPDGLLQPNQPCRTPPEEYRLLDQSILWPVQLWQHLLYTGDRALVHRLIPAVRRLLAGFAGRFAVAGDPRLRGLTGWNWVDHPGRLGDGSLRPIRHDGIPSAINLLYLLALDAAARIEDEAGDLPGAGLHRDRATAVEQLLRREHWCAERGLYADCLVDGRPSAEASVHVNLLAILAGLAPDADGVLARSWRQPEVTQILGPYFRLHLLEVLHRLGRHDELLAEVRDHWGPYLDAGLTTLPEYVAVNGTWPSSLGHPWGAAPAVHLARAIAGLEPLEPGWRRLRAAPRLGGLRQVSCRIPVPGGELRAHWRRRADGRICGRVDAPPGLETILDPDIVAM